MKENKFTNEKISRLFLQLSGPAIVAMVINAVYSIADTAFVGMLGNTSALGGVSIVFPITVLVAAVGQTFGVGTSAYISRLFGEKKVKKAEKVLATFFIVTIISGILLSIISFFFLKPVLYLFGTTDTIYPYARDFAFILLVFGCTFNVLNMYLNNSIRAMGDAKYSMNAIILSAVINIILDPVLIFKFNMGVKGAAVATVIAQAAGTLFLMLYYFKEKPPVKLNIKNFAFETDIFQNVLKTGLPSFTRQALSSVSLAVLNFAGNKFGDAALAAIGIVLRTNSFGNYVVFGLSQGFQPIAAFNYGARHYKRLRESLTVALKWSAGFGFVYSVLMVAFAHRIILLFSKDPEVIAIGVPFLRISCLLFVAIAGYIVYTSLFQAVDRPKQAMILATLRQGIVLIPAIFILTHFFGLTGLIWSQTFADFITIIVTFFYSVKVHKALKDTEKKYGDS